MKTIEEALDEAYKNAGSNAYFGNGFKAGADFAQRWISVDEELPEIGEPVIVCRNTIIGYHFICSEIFYTENKTPLWKSNGDFYLIEDTHWRPIELK